MKRPEVFLTGDGGYDEGIEEALKLTLEEKHFDAVIAEYAMTGQ